MNCFSQLENGIFATKKDLEILSEKQNANILVLSDSHGAAATLFSIIENFGKKADALIFAGDGIYDLLNVMEKCRANFSEKKLLPPVIGFVKGNNDSFSASTSFEKNIKIPSKIVLKAGNRNILVTHGHSEGVYYDFSTLEATAQVFGANAVIFGHTHVPTEMLSKVYLLNPGSVGYPRHKSPPSFAMLEILGPNINSIFYKIQSEKKLEFIPYFPDPFYGF